MIMRFLKRVPAGMMIVPLLIGAFMNTFFPAALKIGSFTTATFSSAGAATAMGIQLFCLGTTLQLRDMPKVVKRGGILLISKFIIGATIGIVIGKIFGFAGICGLTTLAIISAVTNSNGSVYLALMKTYGDTTDCAAMALLALNDGPLFTLIALGASGLANVPFMALVATVIPIIVGMIIGNLDKEMQTFLEPAGNILIPFVGLTLGAGINLSNVVKGGVPGIILGLITVFVGGSFIVFCDKIIGRRPGYAGWAVATTAGNAVAVPAAVGLIDPAWAPYVGEATTQVAASVVVTAILVPLMTNWWAKKYGCPQSEALEAAKLESVK
ncbi:2-keto-3-deoxygluconate permease [Fusobacterium sp.]|uniref:2-keto-3-deoxygluconate permease n=1 Tax=Fusobacterium sp. TaxID=68766 RepID=UPI0028FDDF51|nr:2-keto-3-deoxygluconate permease [Fusobacterium sp.]MDU1912633.1 2-keto-3-deoxygluconate permease [Fusobacterium sp.]